MKKTAIILLLSSFFFASCEKETNDDEMNTCASSHDVTVEYRITNESANVGIEFTGLDATGHLSTLSQNISKTYTSIQVTAKNHNTFSIKAWNVDPSWKNINVDIYVNGVLFKSGSLDHTTATATASGLVE